MWYRKRQNYSIIVYVDYTDGFALSVSCLSPSIHYFPSFNVPFDWYLLCMLDHDVELMQEFEEQCDNISSTKKLGHHKV